MNPKVLVLSGYGINCEEETSYAFKQYGAHTDIVHVNDLIAGDKKMEDYQILALPGGFSYGDDTGAGKGMANRIFNNLQEDILNFVKKDTLTIGICNGFQVLTALGLAPAFGGNYGQRQAALMHNDSARYLNRWVHVKVQSKKCVWTKGIETLYLPIAHGEGKFYMEEENLNKLAENDQIVVTYCKEDGTPANQESPYNPNGSAMDIAGICDETGRVFGLMPHPERGMFFHNQPNFTQEKEMLIREGKELPMMNDNALVFKNAVEYFS